MNIDKLLAERAKTHGEFIIHARVTQRLKGVIYEELGLQRKSLSEVEMEALDMITHKIGRVIAGESLFADHWDDMAGYARLVSLLVVSGVLTQPITQKGNASEAIRVPTPAAAPVGADTFTDEFERDIADIAKRYAPAAPAAPAT